MNLNFFKYHGAGNDFILLDNRKSEYSHLTESNKTIEFLCNRNLGIGADGLMLLEKSKDLDFSMRYFNSDGHEASMCGNGGRCIVLFAHDLGIISGISSFEAVDGMHKAEITSMEGRHIIDLKMQNVSQIERHDGFYTLNTGSPHYVKFVKNINDLDVFSEGKAVRYSPQFVEKGINVNFVEVSEDFLHVRTYERGVENETLACGTGVTAAALVYSMEKDIHDTIQIQALGGKLSVSFEINNQEFKNIWLKGPAKFVFKGIINL